MEDLFSSFYVNGFIPLFPHYKETEEDKLIEFFAKRNTVTPNKLRDDLTLDDVLISDDIFASLLNYKREIIINRVIYKYTFSGLLISREEDYNILENYIIKNDIYNSVPDVKTLRPGYSMINDNIACYVVSKVLAPDPCGPIDIDNQPFVSNEDLSLTNSLTGLVYDDDNTGLIGWHCGAGGGYTPSEPTPDYTDSMWAYANNLNACDYSTQWTPFGTRKVCKDYFNGGKRRTFTLYTNENYLFYKRLKVKVKHQRKRTLYWDKKKADEAAIIINQACFRMSLFN